MALPGPAPAAQHTARGGPPPDKFVIIIFFTGFPQDCKENGSPSAYVRDQKLLEKAGRDDRWLFISFFLIFMLKQDTKRFDCMMQLFTIYYVKLLLGDAF